MVGRSPPHKEATLLMKFLSVCFTLYSTALTFLGNIGQDLRCILDEDIHLFEKFCYQRKEGNEKEVWDSGKRHFSFINHEAHTMEDNYLHTAMEAR